MQTVGLFATTFPFYFICKCHKLVIYSQLDPLCSDGASASPHRLLNLKVIRAVQWVSRCIWQHAFDLMLIGKRLIKDVNVLNKKSHEALQDA